MNADQMRLLLTGPFVVVILTSFLATAALLAGASGRLEQLTTLGARAVGRLSHGRAWLLLWGLAAALLTVSVAAVLFATKVLALLGLLVLLAGLTLAGLGLGVGAARIGRAFSSALGRPGAPALLALSIGLTSLFIATFLPIVGWLIVFLATLAGIGATLDALWRRG